MFQNLMKKLLSDGNLIRWLPHSRELRSHKIPFKFDIFKFINLNVLHSILFKIFNFKTFTRHKIISINTNFENISTYITPIEGLRSPKP
jgi:hypothetical protein